MIREVHAHVALATALCTATAACAPLRPSVSLQPGASLAGYRAFEVAPVSDQTGYALPPDALDAVRLALESRLRSRSHAAAGEPEDTLIIESKLTDFRPGEPFFFTLPSGRRSRCELRSALVDKRSGKVIGVIVASEDEARSPMSVLRTCARMVADEIDRRTR
jgi:hypothetical protein